MRASVVAKLDHLSECETGGLILLPRTIIKDIWTLGSHR